MVLAAEKPHHLVCKYVPKEKTILHFNYIFRVFSIGTFSYQFNKPGVYYYWSGYINSSDIVYSRGVIRVQNSASDKQAELNVVVNNFAGIF